MSNIPDDFQPDAGKSNYLKITPGKHRIRILSVATVGFVCWEEDESGNRKPTRFRKDATAVPMGSKKFLAFPIWNHADNTLRIWEVTQPSIQEKLKSLDKDKEWGGLTGHDIEIERRGTGQLDTKYEVTPKPKSPLDDKIKEELKVGGLPNMEALFEGGDPFAESVDIDDLPF